VEDLRLALRRLAKAVVVITTREGSQRYAMAATAVSELSMEPPSMLICVNQTASIYPILAAGAPFAINILPFDRSDIAALCSGAAKGEARFGMGDWRLPEIDAPFLADAQASIMCSNERMIAYGTHGIFIGNVRNVSVCGDPDPLVYMDGRYVRVSDDGSENG
jgi:flavin reductase (DIM6/NTAB) family NADH-FMN oxidoreductase RutF